MSEQIPEGWEMHSLHDFSTSRRGTTYASSELSEDKESYPLYINMKSFKVGGGYSENGDKFYSSPYSTTQLVRHSDLLIANTDVTESCDILGASVYLPREKLEKDVLFSHHVSALDVSENVNVKFFHFLLCSENVRLKMKRYGRGTTVKMLDMRDVGKLSLPIPSLPEQKKIASILTSVDKVIEKTQSQIDKLQDLKKGTMNELLTNGIGHTEFKDSELGRIPKSWYVIEMSGVSWVIDSLHETPEFSEVGIPMVRVTDIKKGELSLHSTKRVTNKNYQKYIKNHIPKKGDIVISRVGSYGVSSYVSTDDPFCIGQNTAIINPRGIDGRFLYECLISEVVQNQIEFEVAGSGYKSLSLADIRSLKIPVPSDSEQENISNSLNSIDIHMKSLVAKLHQTQSLKKSLMQDLLTGKVRVSVN